MPLNAQTLKKSESPYWTRTLAQKNEGDAVLALPQAGLVIKEIKQPRFGNQKHQ